MPCQYRLHFVVSFAFGEVFAHRILKVARLSARCNYQLSSNSIFGYHKQRLVLTEAKRHSSWKQK